MKKFDQPALLYILDLKKTFSISARICVIKYFKKSAFYIKIQTFNKNKSILGKCKISFLAVLQEISFFLLLIIIKSFKNLGWKELLL